ncbi:MAG: cobalamin B12-binding domain-containing protein, partial [Syntrophales bacterium LBB04]|nr:cobalamin B12-binding domain-containing protein [Syntrophales bacterium LBB04]
MILVNPPITKPCEPPAGLARLAGTLKRHGIDCRLIDANLQGILSLLKVAPQSKDVWTSRAFRHLPSHLSLLTRTDGYENIARYSTAVKDLNRIIRKSCSSPDVRLSLTDYEDRTLLPVRSQDLIHAAEHPEKNPFYPYFREELQSAMEAEGPHVVGFSLNYLSQALTTFAMLGFLRKACANLRLVLGGGLVTSWMSKPEWQNPFGGLVDDMLAGPGEEALLSIMGVPVKDLGSTPDYEAFLGNDYLAPGF